MNHPGGMRCATYAVFAVATAAASPAWAQVEILSVRRSLEAAAHVTSSGSGPDLSQRSLFLEDGLFDDAVGVVAETGILFAQADASMTTTVTPWRVNGRADVSLMTNDDTGFTSVGGVADAQLFVRFQVHEQTQALLDIDVLAFSNAANQFITRLTGPDGDLLNQTTFGGTRTWTLDPGEYTFRLQTRITWNGNVNRDINARGSFEGTLWFVPSPATTMALAPLALAPRRRRTG